MAGDDPGALPPGLREHVNALRRVQTPGPARRRANWAAVEHAVQVRPARTRWTIAVGVASAALAAGLALWWVGRTPTTRLVERDPTSEASQQRASASAAGSVEVRSSRSSSSVPMEQAVPEERPEPIAPAEPPTIERARRARADPPRSSENPPTAAQTSGLAEEIAAFARVREAVAAGRFDDALARLRAYRTAHPSGALAAEGDVTEVEILCRLGRRDEALARQARFLRDRPGSHLAPRVREACP